MSLSRRFFLKGLGGAVVTLPVLPSLLTSSEARAQAAGQQFFVLFQTGHGGLWSSNMYPSLGASPQTMTYAQRTIRKAALNRVVTGTKASLSPVLTADASALTPGLVGKMNVLRGLDIPFYMAHHDSGNLGNFMRAGAQTDNGATDAQLFQTPTIDQLMAWSSGVYPTTPAQRSIIFNGRDMSKFHANPTARSGGIVSVSSTSSSAIGLFNKLFPQGQATSATSDTPRLLDRVYSQYTQLKGDRRLSAEDRARLDEHLTRVNELDRRLNVAVACTPRTPRNDLRDIDQTGYSSNPAAQLARWTNLLDVVSLALTCGLTKVAVLRVGESFSSVSSAAYHGNVAHRGHLAAPGAGTVDAQQDLVATHSSFFGQALVPFVNSLGSRLDQGHVVWTQECGVLTHSSMSMPIVTFGGLGGAFRTGNVVDYRNLGRRVVTQDALKQHDEVRECPGLLLHQWLGNVLTGMGVPKAEWGASSTFGGYPNITFKRLPSYNREQGTSVDDYWPDAVFQAAGEKLPYVTV